MIKRSLKQTSVKQLRDIWISEAARIFNLSRVEALNLLETIGEEIENDDENSNLANTENTQMENTEDELPEIITKVSDWKEDDARRKI